jgi:cellulose synthase/poly-beta-1,6-N-acetylglucosamine synthase-like glycosyltransferase
VSVVIPAYREQAVIGAKVRNTLDNGYPGELEVLVVADDEGTAEAARETGVGVIGSNGRRGKAGALNEGIGRAQHPIVVLTDANGMLEPDGLCNLVRWLSDPEHAAVAGEKRVSSTGGQGAYWAFQSWLKQREARLGTTVGVVGELIALRRDAYRPIPTDLAVDDVWVALDILESGGRIAYEPRARLIEDESLSIGEEWERRTRIIAGTLDVFWRRRSLLAPSRGTLATQLWGHFVVRTSPGPLAHALLLVRAARASRESRVARAFVAIHLFAGLSLLRETQGGRLGPLGRIASQVVFLQAVGVAGTARWLRRRANPELWPKPERAAKATETPPS